MFLIGLIVGLVIGLIIPAPYFHKGDTGYCINLYYWSNKKVMLWYWHGLSCPWYKKFELNHRKAIHEL